MRAFSAVGGTPRFIASAQGCHLTDVDGNDYVDLVSSWGPMILGHAHPAVVESIKWKAPNYEVADDFATLNLRRPSAVQLVLHTGAKVKPEHPEIVVPAPPKLLTWRRRNRAIASFSSLAELEDARAALAGIVRSWAGQVEA